MLVDDYPVPSISNAAIARVAEAWRDVLQAFFVSNTLDVVGMFKAASRHLKRPVEVEIRPDASMGRANAYVSKDRKRVFVRKSRVDGAASGDAESIFDAVHELAHLILHPQEVPLARMIDGNLTQKYIPSDESAEHQANCFARAFLMTNDEVERFPTASMLAEACFTPYVHAARRIEEAQTLQRKVLRKENQADQVWGSARSAPGMDPNFFRLSRGNFLAEKTQYQQPAHHYGWFVDHDSVVTYLEHETD